MVKKKRPQYHDLVAMLNLPYLEIDDPYDVTPEYVQDIDKHIKFFFPDKNAGR